MFAEVSKIEPTSLTSAQITRCITTSISATEAVTVHYEWKICSASNGNALTKNECNGMRLLFLCCMLCCFAARNENKDVLLRFVTEATVN